MTADHPRWPLRDFFAGVAEYAFEARLGIADPPLIDYIADLLARFIHADALYNVRSPAGNRLGEIGLLLAEADARVGDARRDVHRHIGDFALFWTGVYPEALGQAAHSEAKHTRFTDYCTHGKRSYHIASTIPSETDPSSNELLERLSEEFELCAFGLSEARKEWERRDGGRGQLVVFN